MHQCPSVWIPFLSEKKDKLTFLTRLWSLEQQRNVFRFHRNSGLLMTRYNKCCAGCFCRIVLDTDVSAVVVFVLKVSCTAISSAIIQTNLKQIRIAGTTVSLVGNHMMFYKNKKKDLLKNIFNRTNRLNHLLPDYYWQVNRQELRNSPPWSSSIAPVNMLTCD